MNSISIKTLTGLRRTTTPRTSTALEVREDSLVESPVDTEFVPPTDFRVKPVVVQVRTKASP